MIKDVFLHSQKGWSLWVHEGCGDVVSRVYVEAQVLQKPEFVF